MSVFTILLDIYVLPIMTNIKEVLASNLKIHRQARGWSQAKLAEKTGVSTQYIGMLEIKGKFPSSEMIHKLANALSIDPTELFYKEIKVETVIKNAQKAAIEDVNEDLNRLLTEFFTKKLQEYTIEYATTCKEKKSSQV